MLEYAPMLQVSYAQNYAVVILQGLAVHQDLYVEMALQKWLWVLLMNILTRAMTTLSAGIVSSAQSGHENTEIGDHSGFLRGA